MKKHHILGYVLCAVLLLTAGSALSQKTIAPGVRYETSEIEVNDDQYSLFMYSDDGDTVGYYLGVGHSDQLLEITTGALGALSFGSFDEICLFLGTSTDEAYASLDTLISLFECEVGTEIGLPARVAPMSRYLGEYTTAVCTVRKTLLGGKRLVFTFDHGHYQVESHLSRSSIKQLRRGLKFYKKLHPDKQ